MVENAFAERFKEAVRMAGGPSAVSRVLGKSLKTVNRYMTGETHPGFQDTVDICRLAGVSLSWLISGDGLLDGVMGPKSTDDGKKTPIEADDFVLVPILDVVANAGFGFENHGSGEILTHIPFPRALLRRAAVRPESAHFLPIYGDSMAPTLVDGGIALVNSAQRTVIDDEIYVIVIGQQVRFKRVMLSTTGSLTLISDNRDKYPPELLDAADAEQLRVAGKVFWAGGGV